VIKIFFLSEENKSFFLIIRKQDVFISRKSFFEKHLFVDVMFLSGRVFHTLYIIQI